MVLEQINKCDKFFKDNFYHKSQLSYDMQLNIVNWYDNLDQISNIYVENLVQEFWDTFNDPQENEAEQVDDLFFHNSVLSPNKKNDIRNWYNSLSDLDKLYIDFLKKEVEKAISDSEFDLD